MVILLTQLKQNLLIDRKDLAILIFHWIYFCGRRGFICDDFPMQTCYFKSYFFFSVAFTLNIYVEIDVNICAIREVKYMYVLERHIV